jgi:hypothetical protein
MDNPFFSKCLLFSTKCAPFILKIGGDFTFMVKTAKGPELMRIVFIIDLNTSGSNVLLTLKIVDFENVASIRVVHVYVIEGMNA